MDRTLGYGSAVIHGDTLVGMVCFHTHTSGPIYHKSINEYRSLAIVHDTLTSIGGGDDMGMFDDVNTLLSLVGNMWKEILPPMPTRKNVPSCCQHHEASRRKHTTFS